MSGLGQGSGRVVGDQPPRSDVTTTPESCAIFSAHVTEESDSHDDRPSRTAWRNLGVRLFCGPCLRLYPYSADRTKREEDGIN